MNSLTPRSPLPSHRSRTIVTAFITAIISVCVASDHGIAAPSAPPVFTGQEKI